MATRGSFRRIAAEDRPLHLLYFFPDDERNRALIEGEITGTIRTKPVLNLGDVFLAEPLGCYFQIRSRHRESVGEIIDRHHKDMGYETREEALADWVRFHPNVGHRLDYPAWYYRFEGVRTP